MSETALLMELVCQLYEATNFVSWQAAAATLLVACLVAGDEAALDMAQRLIASSRRRWDSPDRSREFLKPSLN